jgi:hypothetical protein
MNVVVSRSECVIPGPVINAVRSVKERGWSDMYDRETVMMLAAALGHSEAAEWLVEHRHLYFLALDEVNAG